MGMLPIALALAGFVFLWAIVNYNSLKQKSDALSKAHYDILEIAKQRQTFLLLLAKEINAPLPDGLTQQFEALMLHANHEQKTETTLKKELKISDHIATLRESVDILLAAGAGKKTLDDLFRMNEHMHRKILQYRIVKKHYNGLVLSIPTRFIAGISGFHVK